MLSDPRHPARLWLNKIWARPAVGTLILAILCAFPPALLMLARLTPIHDSIFWYPWFAHFYESIAHGVIPYWNPYSQLGSPFFPMFQSLGLLDPSNLILALLYKFTRVNSLLLYLIHLFFQFYLFLVGTYFTLIHVTRNVRQSLLFSVVVFLGCLPTIMRQHGLIIFFLIPLTTYCILSFFTETSWKKKGVLLIILGFLFAVSLNTYIPIMFLLHSGLLILLCIIFGVGDFKSSLEFLRNKKGLRWVGLAALIGLMATPPVLALYYELNNNNTELFGGVRFFIKIGKLIPFYASDLTGGSAFLGEISTRVSLSLFNLIGFVVEPFWGQFDFREWHRLSEMRLYLGIIPLLCVIPALGRGRNAYSWVFFSLSLIMLAICCNFSTSSMPGPNFPTTQLMLTIFPFLKNIGTFQNVAGIFVFDLIILAGIGWSCASEPAKRKILLAAALVFLLKGLLNLIYRFEVGELGKFHLVASCTLVVLSLAVFLYHYRPPVIAVVIIIDLLIFVFPVIRLNVTHDYYNTFKEHGLFSPSRQFSFAYYRDPRFLTKPPFPLFGFETMSRQRPVFGGLYLTRIFDGFWAEASPPGAVGFEKGEKNKAIQDLFISIRPPSHQKLKKNESGRWTMDSDLTAQWRFRSPTGVRSVQNWRPKPPLFANMDFEEILAGVFMVEKMGSDQLLVTKYYYDYLANVSLEKQLAVSGGIYPVLNFFPESGVRFCESKYEVVERINRAQLDDLGSQMFIEQEGETARHIRPIKNLSFILEHQNPVCVSLDEKTRIEVAGEKRAPGSSQAVFSILDYGPNKLIFRVVTDQAGWVYYADGFSKHWQAFVNGLPVRIDKTNVNFKSVRVPAGESQVVFTYDPAFYRYSLYVAFCGYVLFLIIIGIMLIGKNRINK
jgi:hypothetical protein